MINIYRAKQLIKIIDKPYFNEQSLDGDDIQFLNNITVNCKWWGCDKQVSLVVNGKVNEQPYCSEDCERISKYHIDNPWVCRICKWRFPTSVIHNKHMIKKHNIPLPFYGSVEEELSFRIAKRDKIMSQKSVNNTEELTLSLRSQQSYQTRIINLLKKER